MLLAQKQTYKIWKIVQTIENLPLEPKGKGGENSNKYLTSNNTGEEEKEKSLRLASQPVFKSASSGFRDSPHLCRNMIKRTREVVQYS